MRDSDDIAVPVQGAESLLDIAALSVLGAVDGVDRNIRALPYRLISINN